MLMEAITDKPDVEYKIRMAFPEDWETMLAVANCESGLRQNIVSHTNDYGLFQINEKSWDSVAQGMGLDYKNNIDDNIKMAQHVYKVQGRNAWVCYTKNLL